MNNEKWIEVFTRATQIFIITRKVWIDLRIKLSTIDFKIIFNPINFLLAKNNSNNSRKFRKIYLHSYSKTFGKSRKIEIVTQISFLDIFLIILDSIDRYKFIETFQKHSRLYILILYNIQQDNDTTTIIWLCKSHEYTKIRLLLVYYSEQCIIITIVVFCRLVTSIVP